MFNVESILLRASIESINVNFKRLALTSLHSFTARTLLRHVHKIIEF